MNQTTLFALLAVLLQAALSAQTAPATPVANGDRHLDITGAMAEPIVYTPPATATPPMPFRNGANERKAMGAGWAGLRSTTPPKQLSNPV